MALVSKKKLEAWLSGEFVLNNSDSPPRWLKQYILDRQDGKCNKCGIVDWMGMPITLQLEHIDGNAFNTVPSNLECLCPNCHSQTPTYGAKNKGRGRQTMKKILGQ